MMCAPEGSSWLQRLLWSFHNAYYRLAVAYACFVLTILAIVEVSR